MQYYLFSLQLYLSLEIFYLSEVPKYLQWLLIFHFLLDKKSAATLGLEGCASRFSGGLCICGSYVYVVRGAIAISVVVYAILHRAFDALDVLCVTSVSFAIVHLSFLSLLCKKLVPQWLKHGLNAYGISLLHQSSAFADTYIIPAFFKIYLFLPR